MLVNDGALVLGKSAPYGAQYVPKIAVPKTGPIISQGNIPEQKWPPNWFGPQS